MEGDIGGDVEIGGDIGIEGERGGYRGRDEGI